MNCEKIVQMPALNLWKNKSSERNSEEVVLPAAVISYGACIRAILKVSTNCRM